MLTSICLFSNSSDPIVPIWGTFSAKVTVVASILETSSTEFTECSFQTQIENSNSSWAVKPTHVLIIQREKCTYFEGKKCKYLEIRNRTTKGNM